MLAYHIRRIEPPQRVQFSDGSGIDNASGREFLRISNGRAFLHQINEPVQESISGIQKHSGNLDDKLVGNRTPCEPRGSFACKLKGPRGDLPLEELNIGQIFSCVGF